MGETEKSEKTSPSNTGTGTPEKKKMPKGGRKGGTIFPRLKLKQALEYSKKLVSKTAVAPQPEATILAGVFNNAGPEGKVRISALKQLGLIQGTPTAYKATQLARDIEAAADEKEKQLLVRRAMLTSKVYRELFDTYQADQASKGKIRGRAQQLGVHPDLSEKCAEFFMTSALTAGMATSEGDGIRLMGATEAALPATPEGETPDGSELEIEGPPDSNAAAGAKDDTDRAEVLVPPAGSQGADATKPPAPRPRTAADVTVNLTVDSSLDSDKLGKQLELLRSYGLI